MPQLLGTFVHVSDLHIGEIDPATGDASVSPAATAAYQQVPWLDGLLGHHGVALEMLEEFLFKIKEQDGQVRLIVTGDLSRCGGVAELELASDYFTTHIDLSPPFGRDVGLAMGGRVLAISGNHDHWGGSNFPVTGKPSKFRQVFPHPTLPCIHTLTLAQHDITFIGINSDADVPALSANRALAIGAFKSDLLAIQAALPPKNANEARIVLIHHSLQAPGFKLRMQGASKTALSEFMFANQVSAILTGHAHSAKFHKFYAKSPGGGSFVAHELRAGSATQHDVVPLKWRNLWNNIPARPHWPKNTVLLHRIHEHAGLLRWTATIYVRTPQGFAPLSAIAPAVFSLI